DKGCEQKHVDQGLHELTVVHRTHAGNKSQYSREPGARCSAGCWWGIGRRRNVRIGWYCRIGDSIRDAILTKDHSANIALAEIAHRLSASAAIPGSCAVSVDGTVHDNLPF